jgi:organic radical activating enzyme
MITMSVALSEQCNLNCTYCNVDKLSKKRISSKLFLDEFWKKRAELPNEKFQIDLYGGEPLLQWDLVKEIIDATQEEKNLQYFMPTNGLLLNDERVDYLNEHNVKVSSVRILSIRLKIVSISPSSFLLSVFSPSKQYVQPKSHSAVVVISRVKLPLFLFLVCCSCKKLICSPN